VRLARAPRRAGEAVAPPARRTWGALARAGSVRSVAWHLAEDPPPAEREEGAVSSVRGESVEGMTAGEPVPQARAAVMPAATVGRGSLARAEALVPAARAAADPVGPVADRRAR
jgi:hypothetical protein